MDKDEEEEVQPVVWSEVGKDDDNMFACPMPNCRKRYARIYNLKAHFNTHTSDPKPFKCKVKGCTAAFTHNDRVTIHVKKFHGKTPKMFGCNFEGCFATFDSDSCLLRHFRNAHPGANFEETMNKIVCHHCNDLFFSRYQLKAHIIKAHGYLCEVCDKICNSETEMRRHAGYHTANAPRSLRPMECKTCSITVNGLKELREHKTTEEHRVNLRNSYTCPICSAQYMSRNSVNVHIKSHEEERELYNCPHEGCTRTYYHMKNLQQHYKSHSDDPMIKPRCDICDKYFSTKQKLRHHQTTMHDPLREIKMQERKEELEKSGPRQQAKRNRLIEKLSHGPDITAVTKTKPGPKPKKIDEPTDAPKLNPEILEVVKTKLAEEKPKRPAYYKRGKPSQVHISNTKKKLKKAKIRAAHAVISESMQNIRLPPPESISPSSPEKLNDLVIASDDLRKTPVVVNI